MNYPATNERIRISEIFLSKIKELETDSDKIVNYYTEYFLILCHSVIDYVVYDFLSSMRPPISMKDMSDISKPRRKKSINHERNNEINDFLNEFADKRKEFLKQLLPSYFFSIRNRIVHGEFPNIYNTKILNNKITRHFQFNLVNYLQINDDGDHLLINNNGDKLIISDQGSVDELDYVKALGDEEKKLLSKMLEEEKPSELLQRYLDQIKQFVLKFESIK